MVKTRPVVEKTPVVVLMNEARLPVMAGSSNRDIGFYCQNVITDHFDLNHCISIF
jgi:hypothetical protein